MHLLLAQGGSTNPSNWIEFVIIGLAISGSAIGWVIRKMSEKTAERRAEAERERRREEMLRTGRVEAGDRTPSAPTVFEAAAPAATAPNAPVSHEDARRRLQELAERRRRELEEMRRRAAQGGGAGASPIPPLPAPVFGGARPSNAPPVRPTPRPAVLPGSRSPAARPTPRPVARAAPMGPTAGGNRPAPPDRDSAVERANRAEAKRRAQQTKEGERATRARVDDTRKAAEVAERARRAAAAQAQQRAAHAASTERAASARPGPVAAQGFGFDFRGLRAAQGKPSPEGIRNLRRAVILAEIFGPPPGMRELGAGGPGGTGER